MFEFQVTEFGKVNSARVCVVVGNERGAAGFGIAKDFEPEKAVRVAYRRAQRDMIQFETHNGQLFHDLVGKVNNTTVVLRASTWPLVCDLFASTHAPLYPSPTFQGGQGSPLSCISRRVHGH